MSDFRPDKDTDELTEEVKEIMEKHDLDEDDARLVKKTMDERSIDEDDAVEIVANLLE
ncbi:MAG TPA: hypothetical protein VMR73_01265 [Candidatus Paceibacterota bacterium]|nr:hypothetical protein [Candidatus Paceibacterota bacterium]